jgi:hypothetical protein
MQRDGQTVAAVDSNVSPEALAVGDQIALTLIQKGYTPTTTSDVGGRVFWEKHDFHFTYPDVLFVLVCVAFLLVWLKGWP